MRNFSLFNKKLCYSIILDNKFSEDQYIFDTYLKGFHRSYRKMVQFPLVPVHMLVKFTETLVIRKAYFACSREYS